MLTDGPEKKSRTQYKRKPLIGCMCPARHIVLVKPDGSVSVTFQGHHNHDVQEEYAVFYVNPVKVCQEIRDLVDHKLLAGMTKTNKIKDDINKSLSDRVDHETLEDERIFQMTKWLEPQMIANRRNELHLSNEYITDPDDATSVCNLVEMWKRKDNDAANPVRYFKPQGVEDTYTCEKENSEYCKKDFLLVWQTEAQAQFMADNPRIVCVDGTHGLTKYGFTLLSVCVINVFGQGLVCGHGITNRENARTWYLTVANLRPVALACKPEVLMSDDTNSAWNGLRLVWPSLRFKLLCHWHVRQNVRKRCYGHAQKVKEEVTEGTCVEINPEKSYGHSAWELFDIMIAEEDEGEFKRLLRAFRISLKAHGQVCN